MTKLKIKNYNYDYLQCAEPYGTRSALVTNSETRARIRVVLQLTRFIIAYIRIYILAVVTYFNKNRGHISHRAIRIKIISNQSRKKQRLAKIALVLSLKNAIIIRYAIIAPYTVQKIAREIILDNNAVTATRKLIQVHKRLRNTRRVA